MLEQAKWIGANTAYGTVCPVFIREFAVKKTISEVTVSITSVGCYEAYINGKRVGKFVLAPGWTSYETRHQVQKYDVKNLLAEKNCIEVYIGDGWQLGGMSYYRRCVYSAKQPMLIMELRITYTDGTQDYIVSDENFKCARTGILMSSIYDGEIYDARVKIDKYERARVIDYPKTALMPQEGEEVHETERIKPIKCTKSKTGYYILDFGQEITGYVEFECSQPKDSVIELVHGEILDYNGDVYTENLRSAKQRIVYISDGHKCIYKPHFTFMGFRYVRVERWYGELDSDAFTAIVIHSDMKRTGTFECGNDKVNKLYRNIVWGQRGNYVDVPTDCPQRDERLGWTGDAQMFVASAAYNYDVHKFFTKWLGDLFSEQFEDGGVPAVIPNVLYEEGKASAAWGDASVICPWTIYRFYGDKELLKQCYDGMCRWIEYIRAQGDNEYLWNTGFHFGDWLAMDNGYGETIGATGTEYIATAYYAYSTSIVIKAGQVLGKDTSEYETLYTNIVKSFRTEYIKDGKPIYQTQTAYVLAIMFELTDDIQAFGEMLDRLIKDNDMKLSTGLVGTPLLLHALTKSGHIDTAYSLLLQEGFPSWLYSVNMGATTVWEHWDGINENGKLWSTEMNSFNHYAYGSVCQWLFDTVAGIHVDDSRVGFENVILCPKPDRRLGRACAEFETEYGKLISKWEYTDKGIEYEFEVPHHARLILGGETEDLEKGVYQFVISQD